MALLGMHPVTTSSPCFQVIKLVGFESSAFHPSLGRTAVCGADPEIGF